MPKLITGHPKYRKHKASGQAIVKIGGQTFYLGPHGTKASHHAYDQIILQWLDNGRCLPDIDGPNYLTITELCIAYFKRCQEYYRKNGKPTDEVTNIRNAIKRLRALYGDELANEFGPKKLKVVRQSMIQADWSRKHINKQVGRIKGMFRWAVGEELIDGSIYEKLRALPGLKAGRTDARETEPVRPVDPKVVEQTLKHIGPVPGDMVRIQLLTGARPGEICQMRPCDIDMTTNEDVWIYVPNEHKTQHHGKRRQIYIGPEAQQILSSYLDRHRESHCFSPAESVEKQRAEKRAKRVRPLRYEYRKRKPNAKRAAKNCYDRNGYRRAIHRAADKAFPAPESISENEKEAWKSQHRWSPNQLRHTKATEIRKVFGLEGAQLILGHAQADVTQIYAERDVKRAIQIARQSG